MASSDQKPQLNKDEVVHDLNSLNYLLRALAKMIDGVPSLPGEFKRISLGAIAATDRLILKLGGNSKLPDKSILPSDQDQVNSNKMEDSKK